MKELRKSSLGLVAVMTLLANTGALANSRVVLNKTSATSIVEMLKDNNVKPNQQGREHSSWNYTHVICSNDTVLAKAQCNLNAANSESQILKNEDAEILIKALKDNKVAPIQFGREGNVWRLTDFQCYSGLSPDHTQSVLGCSFDNPNDASRSAIRSSNGHRVNVLINEDRVSCGYNFFTLKAPELFPAETFTPYSWVGGPRLDDCEIKQKLLEMAALNHGVISAELTYKALKIPQYCNRRPSAPCRYVDGFSILLSIDAVGEFPSRDIELKTSNKEKYL